MKLSRTQIYGIEPLEVVKKRLLAELSEAQWNFQDNKIKIIQNKLQDINDQIDQGKLHYVPF